jgi:hypothetical protein
MKHLSLGPANEREFVLYAETINRSHKMAIGKLKLANRLLCQFYRPIQ